MQIFVELPMVIVNNCYIAQYELLKTMDGAAYTETLQGR